MKSTAESRAFAVQGVRFLLSSNCPGLLGDDEYFTTRGGGLHSLLSNFNSLEPIDPSGGYDARVILTDDAAAPFSVSSEPGLLSIRGPLKELESVSRDKRISIFGNMGLFSKFVVRTLESKGIFSFHSTGFYDRKRNRLFLVLGGSGSGKSTVLLAAITRGYEVFSTEITHVTLAGGDVVLRKGPVIQNCRVGNLVEDFPELIERFHIQDLPRERVWQHYRAVDLSSVAVPEAELVNPDIEILFTRIESSRANNVRGEASRYGLLTGLYEGLTDKLSPPSLVYGRFFVPTLDSREASEERFRFIEKFLRQGSFAGTWDVLAGPHTCLDGLSDNETFKEMIHETA